MAGNICIWRNRCKLPGQAQPLHIPFGWERRVGTQHSVQLGSQYKPCKYPTVGISRPTFKSSHTHMEKQITSDDIRQNSSADLSSHTLSDMCWPQGAGLVLCDHRRQCSILSHKSNVLLAANKHLPWWPSILQGKEKEFSFLMSWHVMTRGTTDPKLNPQKSQAQARLTQVGFWYL
jgi:hypothetical protein